MMLNARRRRGALAYFAASCSFLLFYFVASFNKLRGNTVHSPFFEVMPWQMVDYDEYDCGCPRSGPPLTSEIPRSLCSDWSTSRGPDQKVVSYTLYGDSKNADVHRKYFASVEDRLNDVAKSYKGFVVRLYHNLSTSNSEEKKLLCHMYCEYPIFDPCQVKHLYHRPSDQISLNSSRSGKEGANPRRGKEGANPRRGNDLPLKALKPLTALRMLKRSKEPQTYETLLVGKMWRFLVMADPLVTEFLVRDVDSVVLEREVAAVEQWLYNSTALLHAMRDHPSHNGLILAGLWGGSRARNGDKLNKLLWNMMRWPPRNLWDYDQILLKREVWPEVIDDVLVHDSYFCGNPKFQSKHRSEPFPTQRHAHYFVGWGPTRSSSELDSITKCPRMCRPANHQDWVLC